MANAVASSSTAPSTSKGSGAPPPSTSSTEALRPLYEESSQYRNWRYSKEQLFKMRKELNEKAVEGVRKNLQAEKEALAEEEAYNPNSTSTPKPTTPPPSEVKYLTVEDELALINYYIGNIPPTCAGLAINQAVEATTILYLKRFYLVNTCMDYHPGKIMPTCLYLALKAEHTAWQIDQFASRFAKLSPDEIIQNEFLVAQSLNFEFKVHHPHTALHGFFLDFQSIPTLLTLPGPSLPQLLASSLQTLSSLSLPLDLSLIYSPSHIALAALHFHSPDHVTTYLQAKETLSKEKAAKVLDKVTVLESEKVLRVVEEIVEELKGEERRRKEDEGGKKRAGRVKEVDRRLRGCGNPARVVGSALYRKRQAQELAESEVKRAKKSLKEKDFRKNDASVFGDEIVVIPKTEEGTRAVIEKVPGGPMGDGIGEDPF